MFIIRKIGYVIALALLSLFAIWYGNYQYGVGDQIIHIPYIKYLLNPNLYAGDTLIQVLKSKPSLFWDATLFMFKVSGLEYGLFILQFLSALIYLYSIKLLTKVITNSEFGSWIAVILALFPHYSFGYSSLFVYSSFIPRNFTIGPIILAIALHITNRKKFSYVLLGLMANFHIISVLPVVLSLLSYDIFRTIAKKQNRNIRQFVINVGLFVIAAAPLLNLFQNFEQKNTEYPNLEQEYLNYYNSVLTPFYDVSDFNGLTMLIDAILIILLSGVGLIYLKKLSQKSRLTLLTILVISTALVGISIIVENWYPNPFLLQLQVGRSGQYSTLVFIVLLSHFIFELYVKSRQIVAANLLFLSVIMPLASMILAGAILVNKSKKTLWTYTLILNTLILLLFINWNALSYLKYHKPSININPKDSENVAAQLWILNNTPVTAKILTPYYIGGFTEPDFRTISERTNILTNGEIVETILNTSLLQTTISKINDLTTNNYTYLSQQDHLFDYEISRRLFHDTLRNNWEQLVDKYEIDYLVVEKELDPLIARDNVYENSRYKIYKLR